MKLKSKQTGEIMKFDVILVAKDVKGNEVAHLEYDSIKDFTDHWEDAPEEPKEYWYIAELCGGLQKKQDTDSSEDRFNKQIGNHFETEEEAEEAVERLRAWTRLEDKGLKFNGLEVFSEGLLKIDGALSALKGADNAERLKMIDDLELLFSGGEE